MNQQRGAVSIFIVVFTALLVTIVTTSFVQLMMRNQQQATNNDLSQSAFDSALAGVEDAKRALVRLKECRLTPLAGNCPALTPLLTDEDQDCDVLDQAGVVEFTDGKERRVGEPEANQAYTCVKIDVTTEAYEGILDAADDQVLIPLDSVGSADAIDAIRVSWFNACDVGSPDPSNPSAGCTATMNPTLAAAPAGSLPPSSEWPGTQPPILRTQLIQYSGSLNLDGFDQAGTDMAKTLFLYPTDVAGTNQFNFETDSRRQIEVKNIPQEVRCNTNFTTQDGYSCQGVIQLSPMTSRQAYLHLSSIYNKAHFKIELCSTATCAPGSIIDFDGVQPRVDSTGRASSLFRRIEARVFLAPGGGPTLQFPSAALSLRNSLCKDIFVTNTAGDFVQDNDGVECDPDN